MIDDQDGEHVLAEPDGTRTIPTQTEVVPEPALNANLPPARPYPGFWQAIGLLLLCTALQIPMGIPIHITKFSRHPIAVAIPILIATAIVIVLGYKNSHAAFREMFPFRAVPISTMFALVLAVFGMYLMLGKLGSLLADILPPPESFSQFMQDLIGSRQSFWGSFIAGVLLLPFGEEVLFRGLILHGFLKRYGVKKAIGASALLFGLMHGNPWQFPTTACLGIFLAWCCIRAHSLIPCLFAHAANNSFSFTILAFQRKSPAGATGAAGAAKAAPADHLWWAIVGLLLAALGIYLMKRCFDRTDRDSLAAVSL